MNHRSDSVLNLVSKTAAITDTQLADRNVTVQRDRLFEQIVAASSAAETARTHRAVAGRSPRRTAMSMAGAIAVVVAVGFAIVAQTAVSPTKAKAAGFAFSRHGGYVDATIDDPSAPADSMKAAFANAGLDISVGVIPSSPSLAGSITFLDTPSSFEPIYGPEGSCLLPGGGTRCVIGMRVPADFSGTASIQVNGTPPAGELYNSVNDAFAPRRRSTAAAFEG